MLQNRQGRFYGDTFGHHDGTIGSDGPHEGWQLILWDADRVIHVKSRLNAAGLPARSNLPIACHGIAAWRLADTGEVVVFCGDPQVF